MPRNDVIKNFGEYVKCPDCAAFMTTKTQNTHTHIGLRELPDHIHVSVHCKKCGFEQYGLRIDYHAT